MDPDEVRKNMIEKANIVLALATLENPQSIDLVAVDLAEAVHDLDEWLRSGGFLPDVWAVKK